MAVSKFENDNFTLIYDGTISRTSTNVRIPGLSKYRVFVGKMVSSYFAGTALGLRVGSTDIRWIGISGTGAGAVPSIIEWTTSGDTVVRCSMAELGAQAAGIAFVHGII